MCILKGSSKGLTVWMDWISKEQKNLDSMQLANRWVGYTILSHLIYIILKSVNETINRKILSKIK